LIDDIHQYPGWSEELLHIHYELPEMQLIFSVSAAAFSTCKEIHSNKQIVMYTLAWTFLA
jgi:hypothetical protein